MSKLIQSKRYMLHGIKMAVCMKAFMCSHMNVEQSEHLLDMYDCVCVCVAVLLCCCVVVCMRSDIKMKITTVSVNWPCIAYFRSVRCSTGEVSLHFKLHYLNCGFFR